MKTSGMINKKYSTSLIARYQLNLVERAELSGIHRNTRRYWKNINLENYIGFEKDDLFDQKMKLTAAVLKNQKLFRLVKCLYLLQVLYRQLFESMRKKKRALFNNKDIIIQTASLLEKYLNSKKMSKWMGISYQKIARWKREKSCRHTIIKKCIRQHPLQLTLREQFAVRDLVSEPQNFNLPVSYIYSQMVRKNIAFMNLNTFYRYANQFIDGLTRKERARQEIHTVKAKNIFQILHMDTTIVRAKDGTRLFVHFIMDNFSRAILGAKVSFSAQSKLAAENLKEVFERYNLFYRPLQLYCDDGSENKGHVNELLEKDKKIKVEKIVTSFNLHQYNNMIEAFNKKFKQIIVKRFSFNDKDDLERQLPEMVDYYNNLFQPMINHLAPNEVLHGIKPDKNSLKKKIELAAQKRYAENKLNLCPACS